jgi:hypothetical protein
MEGRGMEARILYKCDPNKNTECDKNGCKHNPNSEHPYCEHTAHKEFSTDGIPVLLSCPYCQTPNTIDNYGEINVVGKVVIECKGCEKLFILRDDGDGEYIYAPGAAETNTI